MHLTLIGDFSGKNLEALTADLKHISEYAYASNSLYRSASVSVSSVAYVISRIEGDAVVVGFMTCLNRIPGHGQCVSPNHMLNALGKAGQKVEAVVRKYLKLKEEQGFILHLSAY